MPTRTPAASRRPARDRRTDVDAAARYRHSDDRQRPEHVGIHEDPQALLERARDRDHRDGWLLEDELARRASLLGSSSEAVVPTMGAAAAGHWYRDWVVRRTRDRLHPSDDRTDQGSPPPYGNAGWERSPVL